MRQPFGVNLEGLKRRGFDKPTMHAIRNVYKMIYRSGKTLEEVLPEIPHQHAGFRRKRIHLHT